jgi:hypothetical protein
VVAAAVPLVGAAPARAVPAREPVPRTLARHRSPGHGIRVGRTSFTVSHLAVSWYGSGQPGVRVRTGDGWADWQAARAVCGNRHDRRPSPRRSAILTVPGTLGYEIDAAGTARLNVTELDTATPPGTGRTPTGSTTYPYVRIEGYTAAVPYRRRADWGADESYRFSGGVEVFPPDHHPLQTLTVHHTAGANDDPDPAATVRAIYYYDAVTQGWGDVGYHFLVDELGRVYEGRYSGADGAPGFGPHQTVGLRQAVTGAHLGGFNSGNVGVVLLGDFTSRLPTPAARAALGDLLAVLASAGRLDPVGTTDYVNPVTGATAQVPTVSGHRDWAATECPGGLFHPELTSVRSEVAAQMYT